MLIDIVCFLSICRQEPNTMERKQPLMEPCFTSAQIVMSLQPPHGVDTMLQCLPTRTFTACCTSSLMTPGNFIFKNSPTTALCMPVIPTTPVKSGTLTVVTTAAGCFGSSTSTSINATSSVNPPEQSVIGVGNQPQGGAFFTQQPLQLGYVTLNPAQVKTLSAAMATSTSTSLETTVVVVTTSTASPIITMTKTTPVLQTIPAGSSSSNSSGVNVKVKAPIVNLNLPPGGVTCTSKESGVKDHLMTVLIPNTMGVKTVPHASASQPMKSDIPLLNWPVSLTTKPICSVTTVPSLTSVVHIPVTAMQQGSGGSPGVVPKLHILPTGLAVMNYASGSVMTPGTLLTAGGATVPSSSNTGAQVPVSSQNGKLPGVPTSCSLPLTTGILVPTIPSSASTLNTHPRVKTPTKLQTDSSDKIGQPQVVGPLNIRVPLLTPQVAPPAGNAQQKAILHLPLMKPSMTSSYPVLAGNIFTSPPSSIGKLHLTGVTQACPVSQNRVVTVSQNAPLYHLVPSSALAGSVSLTKTVESSSSQLPNGKQVKRQTTASVHPVLQSGTQYVTINKGVTQVHETHTTKKKSVVQTCTPAMYNQLKNNVYLTNVTGC